MLRRESKFLGSAIDFEMFTGIFFSMLLVFCFLIFTAILSKGSTKLINSLKVQIAIENDLSDIEIVRIINKLSESDIISGSTNSVVSYSSKYEAANDIIRDTLVDFGDVIENNPLKQKVCFSVDPFLNISFGDEKELFKEIFSYQVEIDYEKSIFKSLSSKIKLMHKMTLAIGLALLFITFIIIRNLIKLFFYSHKVKIRIMMLIGAKLSFVLKLYIKKLLILCFIASIINLNIVFFMYNYLIDIDSVNFLLNGLKIFDVSVISFAILIAFSILIVFCVHKNVKFHAYQSELV